MIRYKECQRNHAAHLGGHVLDGCGEFMPAGDSNTPLALKCAACDCHRNFHRQVVDGETTTVPPPLRIPPSVPPNHYISFNGVKEGSSVGSEQRRRKGPVMMNFGGMAESSSEGLIAGAKKKRYRTKFTEEQKEKMMEFAEKIGWSIQKQEEKELQRFCAEVGVKRRVFKIWLHNNKQASRKAPLIDK